MLVRRFAWLLTLAAVTGCKPEEPEPEDRVLDEALQPSTGEVVDCEGTALRAADPYEGGEPVDVLDDLTLQVGILLYEVQDVEIRNCSLEGFETAILVVGGSDHVIEDNEFEGIGQAIQVEDSPDVVIRRNDFTGGSGVFVTRRSHRAVISENQFEQVDNAVATYDPPAGDAVVLLHIVDGTLYQVPNVAGSLDDIEIADNDIGLEGIEAIGVYNAVRSKNTTVQDNTITGGMAGIYLPGFPAGTKVGLPGTCSGDPERYCSADKDCFIHGFDVVAQGTCTFPGERTCWFSGTPCTEDCDVETDDICGYFVEDSTVVDSSYVTRNTVTDSCLGLWALFAFQPIFEANDLTGPDDASNCAWTTGISLIEHAFESGIVIGNQVAGYQDGLDLYQGFATEFGARVTKNEFAGNDIPWWAFAENPMTMEPIALHPIELSYSGEGNWWGLSCDEGVNGFPPQSFCVGGDNHYDVCTGPEGCLGGECVAATGVTDSHPYGGPIGTASNPCVP